MRAVFGRDTLAAGEILRMKYCENIASMYKLRTRAENWAQWAKDNRAMAETLNEAEKIYNVGNG